MANIILEVCVDDPAGLTEAIAGGADRVELCAALALGGLTPSQGLMELAAQATTPCYPIIRPRSGDFSYTVAEVAVMRADIRAARALGLKGVVLGASHPDGRLNETVLRVLLDEAAGLDVTLHRCIDLTPNKLQAVATARSLGFRRILSSGGALTAADGAETLAAMMQAAGDGVIIMPGSGVSLETLPKLSHLGLREIHASCASALPSGGPAREFGFQSGTEKRTDRVKVAALKAALSG
ncbi:copper homeostasis protein CutC [Cypionkella aquatica]|uniref:PF03932 family protein CutC n=1 Tax=Cypionkella aquatica TaxID=1756042 RepID=A0AA37TXM2_9RHOB|nr:copper homeostasis protein CutC [Cypionkella aquatica]GLS86322.1 copper homeostasis protein CutC [Cypionkella aquatica]